MIVSDNNALTPRDVLAEHCATLTKSAHIAAFIGRSGKTIRDAVRSARLRDADGTPSALPAVYVSRDGDVALSGAHKRAIAYTFVRSDDDATAILARHGM